MALSTARMHKVRGRPPLLAAGISSFIHSHSSSVRSLGYVCSFILLFYTTHEDFSDRLLEERDEFPLGLRIALDVALRHGQAGMARELLHVPETAPDLRHAARRTRNEGAASRVRRTAVHLQRGIEPVEPQPHRRP